jgi:hypothetical protein
MRNVIAKRQAPSRLPRKGAPPARRIVVLQISVLLGAAMDDILSRGGDREPSPWPRRLAVIGAVLLAVVGGVIYHPGCSSDARHL